ncbi:Spy/CpxP family protein refolding chaperone [Methylococcus capsulatus]|nr:Spy/CpxP family protein refolding chaperone [Methylococcus capsulatus]QXP93185.1 Spy/CpxP family protein refolding chaperone [Methylococcus capsulatus]
MPTHVRISFQLTRSVMKTAIKILALAIALAAQPVFAGRDPGERLEHMKKELKLTPEQTEQVRKILEEFEPQRRALHEQKRALHEQVRSRLKAVLSKEQGEKLDKMAEERRARHHRGWDTEPGKSPSP